MNDFHRFILQNLVSFYDTKLIYLEAVSVHKEREAEKQMCEMTSKKDEMTKE